tara:strand:+ start:2170 stop:2574 length:405 start_codon:yes stop_codon:yes gene_type:complete
MKIDSVCIIDDDPIFVYGTKVLLNYNRSFCSNILVYENGKEALDDLRFMMKSKIEFPEVIFLDLNMPIMNGWDFLDEFIKLDTQEKVRVYVVSSSINEMDKQRALKYNIVVDFISKPFTAAKLEQLIMQAGVKP